MPVWLVVVVVVAGIFFWSVLAFVVAVVVGGALRTSLRSATLRDGPDGSAPGSGIDDDPAVS